METDSVEEMSFVWNENLYERGDSNTKKRVPAKKYLVDKVEIIFLV